MSVRRVGRTTSAMTPSIGSPFVFLTVAEKKSGSPSVEGFARREPEGTRGASVVQKGPGSQERVHPCSTVNEVEGSRGQRKGMETPKRQAPQEDRQTK